MNNQNSSISRRRLLQGGLSVSALSALGNLASADPAKQPAPELPQGAVILFQGDSITDAERKKEVLEANDNKALGTGYAAMLAGLLLADHPDRGLQIHNRGISGNKIPDLTARWDQDAVALKPDILSAIPVDVRRSRESRSRRVLAVGRHPPIDRRTCHHGPQLAGSDGNMNDRRI